MRAARLVAGALAGALCLGTPVRGAGGVDAREAFARLKSLAGDWEGKVTGTEVTVPWQFRATSAGDALIETLFAGSPGEMISVYHLVGDELFLTHYCFGNQPRLRLDRSGSSAEVLRFAFDGGSNLDPARDSHLHSGWLRLVDGDTLEGEWLFFKDGKPRQSGEMRLTRKSTLPTPARR
jgi:hypothetical protein